MEAAGIGPASAKSQPKTLHAYLIDYRLHLCSIYQQIYHSLHLSFKTYLYLSSETEFFICFDTGKRSHEAGLDCSALNIVQRNNFVVVIYWLGRFLKRPTTILYMRLSISYITSKPLRPQWKTETKLSKNFNAYRGAWTPDHWFTKPELYRWAM